MVFVSLACQICLYKCRTVFDFKKHVQSPEHVLKMRELFPNDGIKRIGYLPFINFLNPNQNSNNPIVGVSLLTMCLCSDGGPWLYLCHSCQEMCSKSNILDHLSSGDHYSNYFNYTDPNALSFSWISGMDVRKTLWTPLTNENKKSEYLQLLHLPTNLMIKFQSSTYSEVMNTLRENDKLLELFEAVQPKRMKIQTYQRDSNRKHPLLGLQHLVECICVGPREKSHYVCTLCSLTVPPHMIIRHVLSFDHIFTYFKTWHPQTLLSKETYRKYNKFFASWMLDLSKQSEQVHGTANADIKQVIMEHDEFNLVDFTCYTEALKKLESFTSSSLTTTVTPGTKLECSIATPPPASKYKIRCQDCNITFDKLFQYLRHFSHLKHRKNLKKHFGEAESFDHQPAKFYLGLYSYIQACFERNEPAVGAHLVVTCISSQVEESPIYVCFACQDCFPQWSLDEHFTSRKHLIHTLLYQNPWRLPFAWEDHLDDTDLMLMAWEEEKERGPSQMTLKVFDIPHRILMNFNPLSYSKVLEELKLYHTLLKRDVPVCETYSKLQENDRFPLLGKPFLVCWYNDASESQQSGSLCLLCQRLLSDIESYAHIFSREHVTAFLDCFHPGSLDSSTNNAEILLDLAKLAARIHPILHVQVITLERPIREPCSYFTARKILQSAKNKEGNGSIEPSITPKMKLVPRKTLKEVDKDHGSDNSQKSSSNTNAKLSVESGQPEENKDEKKIPSPSENESQLKGEGVSSSDELKNADKTCQAIKEKKEEPTVPSGEIPESNQSTDRDDVAGKSESSKEVPAQLTSDAYKEGERKRPRSMSEVSQKTTCPNKDAGGEMDHKRRRLTSHEDTVCEETSKKSNNEQNVEKAADVEKSRKAATDKGSSTPLQCSCDQGKPNYLCEHCFLQVSKRDISSHVIGFDHQETDVVDMEIDDSDDSQSAADVCLMTDKTTPESNKDDTMTHLKLPESVDNSCTCLTVSRSSENMLSPNVSTSETTTSRREGVMAATSKCTAASSKLKGSTSSSNISNTTSTTKPAAVSRPPESRIGVASKTKATSCNVAPTSQKRSMVVCEATWRPAPSSRTGNPRKCSEAVSSSEMPKTSVKGGTSKTSAKIVHVKHSVGENVDDAPRIQKKLAAPPLTTVTTAKKPPIEPTSASDRKPKEGIPTVGLNQLILVTCEGKKQIYCQLCSVKLTQSSNIHLTDRKHQLKYVKLRYPGQSLNLKSAQLQKIVENLAKVEKDLESRNIQKIEVNKDVYNELRDLPQEKIFEKLKKIIGKRYTPASSSVTPAETLRRDAAGASPCEVSSTDDGISTPQNEMSGLSTDNQPEQKNNNKLQMPNSQVGEDASVAATRSVRAQSFDREGTETDELIQVHLRPSSKFNENYSESNPGPSIQAEEKQAVTGEIPQGCSRLSTYLRVKRVDEEQIIGLGYVWECQGISQKTFFLCESCRKLLSLSDICQHMVSSDHQLQFMLSKCADIMSVFWTQEDIPQDVKWHFFKDAVQKISKRERDKKIDAKVVLLGQELYESVRTAPFSEAVKIVRNIKNEKTQSAFCRPTSVSPKNNQQPENRQSLEESPPTEMQSAKALERNQGSDNAEVLPTEVRQTPEKPSMAESRVSSPLAVRCFSSKADSVVSPSPSPSTCHIPQEACSSISVQQSTSPPPQPQNPLLPVQVKQEELDSSKADSVVSPYPSPSTCLIPQEACSSISVKQSTLPPPQPQSTLLPVQVKQEELDSEYPSFATVNPEVSQTLSVSPGEKSLPTRKGPADTHVETLFSSCTINPPEELPASCTRSPMQLIAKPSSESASESSLVNPAATTAQMYSKDKNTEPQSDQQNTVTTDWALYALIDLVRNSKSGISSCKFAPDAKAVNSYVTSLSENMKEKRDIKRVKTEFEVGDSSTTAAGYVTQANLASSGSKSSSEDYLTWGNPSFGATEGKTAGTIAPTATTADQPSHAATNHNLGQKLEPQDDTETKMTGVSPSPINTIITDRPKSTKPKFTGTYKVEDHTEMSTGQKVSLPTLQRTSPSDTLVASGGHGQYSQPVYPASGAVSGYTAPNNPAFHTGSLYQHQEYARMQFYPSQLHPVQGVNPYSLQSFGNSLATAMPIGWGSLDIQQSQQQQLVQHLPQLMQQHQQIATQQQLQQLQQQLQLLQQRLQQLQPQLQIPQQQQQQQLQQQQVDQPEQQQQAQQQQAQQQQAQQQQYLSWTRAWESMQ